MHPAMHAAAAFAVVTQGRRQSCLPLILRPFPVVFEYTTLPTDCNVITCLMHVYVLIYCCRVSEAARRAERERAEAAQRLAVYERTAREELDALRAEREAARQAFESSQALLDAELAARTAQELRLREAELARRQAEQEAKRCARED